MKLYSFGAELGAPGNCGISFICLKQLNLMLINGEVFPEGLRLLPVGLWRAPL